MYSSVSKVFRRFFVASLVGLALSVVFPASAHNSSKGISAIKFKLLPDKIEVQAAISFSDVDLLYKLDKNADDSIASEEIVAVLKQLESFPVNEIESSVDGFTGKPLDIKATLQESNFEVHWNYTGALTSTLKMRSPVMRKLTPDHQQFVTVTDAADQTVIEKILKVDDTDFQYTLPTAAAKAETTANTSTSKWQIFKSFLVTGIEHILYDENTKVTDHILFLLALLVICERFRDIVKIITSFTIAHSLTLALATLELVPTPKRIIEPLIAATIVYVGIENLLKLKTLRWRWIVTFLFGLIHGFGFASSLKEQIGQGSLIVPLISFNLGVEFGQILIAAIVLPLFWQVKKIPSVGPRWVPICSCGVVIAGTWWLLQRL